MVSRNQDNFLTLCKEIEHIMDSSNFEELTEVWQNIKRFAHKMSLFFGLKLKYEC